MSHFKYDKAIVQRATRRDPKREAEDARQDGFFGYTEFRLVPIRDIVPDAVWMPSRIEKIREGILAKKALPPIHVSQDSAGRFHISDGIHRYNASLEAGFTHIPALVSVHVDTPEMKEPELPERPKLNVGDPVLLREPPRGTVPWAVIEQVLYSSTHRGVQRHHYALVGIRKGEADFIGDHRDDQLDVPPGPMPQNLRALFQAYDQWPREAPPAWARVASRWLNRQ